jgi:hypothetical protein
MDVSKALKELSEPHSREEKIDAIIARCAHLAGLKYSRCYEIYYGRARRIEPAEIARISEALKQKRAEDIRNELSELRLRLTRLESLLVLSDQEFHRAPIYQTRPQVRRPR